MRPFAYSAATSLLAAAATLARDPQARVIAGGTTLLDLMKLDVERPRRLIDLNGLAEREPELAAVTVLPDGGVRVGALVRNSDLAHHPLVEARFPVLAEALLAGASPQLRNMATVGGNLLQRTRCPYFRDTATACNKREPGTGCSAAEGWTRLHAVLGASAHCLAASPGDMPVALVALDAQVNLLGSAGVRRVPLTQFYLLPGEHPERDTLLEPGELITSVDVPARTFSRRSHYRKVRDRASYAFALASAAVALDLDGDVVRDVRIALGGVGTIPWRCMGAEHALRGARTGPESFRSAAEAALEGAVPFPDNGFKIELAKRTVMRALATAAAR